MKLSMRPSPRVTVTTPEVGTGKRAGIVAGPAGAEGPLGAAVAVVIPRQRKMRGGRAYVVILGLELVACTDVRGVSTEQCNGRVIRCVTCLIAAGASRITTGSRLLVATTTSSIATVFIAAAAIHRRLISRCRRHGVARRRDAHLDRLRRQVSNNVDERIALIVEKQIDILNRRGRRGYDREGIVPFRVGRQHTRRGIDIGIADRTTVTAKCRTGLVIGDLEKVVNPAVARTARDLGLARHLSIAAAYGGGSELKNNAIDFQIGFALPCRGHRGIVDRTAAGAGIVRPGLIGEFDGQGEVLPGEAAAGAEKPRPVRTGIDRPRDRGRDDIRRPCRQRKRRGDHRREANSEKNRGSISKGGRFCRPAFALLETYHREPRDPRRTRVLIPAFLKTVNERQIDRGILMAPGCQTAIPAAALRAPQVSCRGESERHGR